MDEITKVLNYLGIDFDYSTKSEVSMAIRHYVEKINREIPDPLRYKVILAPASGKLYKVRPEIQKLCPNKNQKFHWIVAHLFHILKRGRPNLEPAVACLTTRMCDPTDDD